ncbi:MAG TPA: WG repeat-containing protein [Saprospiraceae bacterium]|nr:WG repeat-containing protein [Saprospiraceae bacterium]
MEKKIALLSLVLTFSMIINYECTCQNLIETLIPYREKEKWGYKDRQGKKIIEPKYDKASLYSKSLDFTNNDEYYDQYESINVAPLALATRDDINELLNFEGKVIFSSPHKFNLIQSSTGIYICPDDSETENNENLMKCYKMSSNRKYISSFEVDYIEEGDDYYVNFYNANDIEFQDQTLFSNNEVILCDYKFQPFLKPIYDVAFISYNGYYIGQRYNEETGNNKKFLVNNEKIIYQFEDNQIPNSYVGYGKFQFQQDSTLYLIDTLGNIEIFGRLQNLSQFDEYGYAQANTLDYKLCLVNIKGTIKYQTENNYDYIRVQRFKSYNHYIIGDSYFSSLSGKVTLVEQETSSNQTPSNNDGSQCFEDGLKLFNNKNNYGLKNASDQVILEANYDYISRIDDIGWDALVTSNERKFFIPTGKGKFINNHYDDYVIQNGSKLVECAYGGKVDLYTIDGTKLNVNPIIKLIHFYDTIAHSNIAFIDSNYQLFIYKNEILNPSCFIEKSEIESFILNIFDMKANEKWLYCTLFEPDRKYYSANCELITSKNGRCVSLLNDIAVISKNQSYGIERISTGEVLIEPKFKFYPHSVGRDSVVCLIINDTLAKCVSYNTNDIFYYPIKYNSRSRVVNSNRRAVSKDCNEGYVNANDELVIDMKFSKANDFNNGFALVKTQKKEGLIDTSGTFVIPPIYEGITPNIDYTFFYCFKNDSLHIYDKHFKILLRQYYSMKYYTEFCYFYKSKFCLLPDKDYWKIIDDSGAVVKNIVAKNCNGEFPIIFDDKSNAYYVMAKELVRINNPNSIVLKNGNTLNKIDKYFEIRDKKGNCLLKYEYQFDRFLENGDSTLILCGKSSSRDYLKAVYDINGKEIIPFDNFEIEHMESHGLFLIRINEESVGFLDYVGNRF